MRLKKETIDMLFNVQQLGSNGVDRPIDSASRSSKVIIISYMPCVFVLFTFKSITEYEHN